ncbi:uncharacterized protein LOC113228249 [Hyposmocoma kahamanoa]|uniref:uncharacterized protein LOC113228249 n=1 Tax=Hyposmocoma kahamanoa TaxID=1477025 RepID=UPI000E6D5EE0|nr:uncharacterized protein LOC113228249 [Hyposmocoma kahamanoa]
METIKLEYAKYKDIVQGNFIDTYKNLTYKHVMGLQWATQHCSNVKFVLKIDDDIFVNVEELKVLLNNFSSEVDKDLIACKVNNNLVVQRNKYNKWFVSKDEYEKDKYPQYCTGSFIVYSQEIALRLVAASKTTQYIYVDDFYVTGLLANKLKVNVTNIQHLYMKSTDYYDAVSKGFIEKTYVFGPINFSPQYIERLWMMTKMSRDKRKSDDTKGNTSSTEFNKSTTILNYREIPGTTKYGKGKNKKYTELAVDIIQGIPEFYPVHAKDEKTSDGIVVNIDELKNVLQHRLRNKNKYLIACRLNTDLLVKRSKSDTFYVSKEEYRRKHFPTCCSGLFIIYSPDSAARLVESSRTSPYLYLNNVYVTGTVSMKLKINITDISDLTLEQHRFDDLIYDDDENLGNFLFGPQSITPDNIRTLWKFLKYIKKDNKPIEDNKKQTEIRNTTTLRIFNEVDRELIACKFNSNLMVHRSKYNKWFVSRDEYEQDKYPQYCTGSFILYSQKIALRMVAASKTTQYIHVDDFYVTGLLANKLKVNITNIEHLYIKPAEYKDADSKGFVEKTYVFGPINSSPQDNERLWTLTKISRHKRKLGDEKRNKKSTEFSEPTTISNHQGTPGSRKHGNGQHRKSQGIPEFRKNESNITNMTLYPVHAKDEKGKNKKSNESDGIKPGNYNTLTRPIKGKQRETTDLMDIYVPIPKVVLAKFRKKTNERNMTMLMFKRLGTMTNSTKLNKQIFTRKRIQR